MALTDLTRISTSGIATGSTIDSPILRKDVDFRGDKVGVTSALFDSSEKRLDFKDNVKLRFGDSGDLSLYHEPNNSFIKNTTGQLALQTPQWGVQGIGTEGYNIYCVAGQQIQLYYAGNKKFETTSTGAVVTGILTATSFSGGVVGGGGINAGVVTCTGLDLNGNGDVSGNFVIGGDLTVNGTTTTLDTNLTEVDRIEVGANSNSVVGVAITQSGSADIINLYDGSTKKLVVDDQGNVGIKTLAPAHDLDVYLNGRFNQLGAGGYGVLVGGGTHTGGFTYMSSGDMEISCAMTNKDIVFSDAVGGNQRMRLTGDTGRLGIGTDNPDRMLHIRGTGNALLKMEGDYSGSVTGIEGVLTASGANRYVTGVYGKVVNTSGSESNVASIRLWNEQASPTTSDSPGYITFNTTSNNSSTSTEKLRIQSDGKVGINTINPLSGTHISDGTAYGSPQNSGRKGTLTISAGSESSADIQLLSANYNHIFFGDSADPNTGIIHYNHTGTNTDSMNFVTAGEQRLRITSGGTVAIPSQGASNANPRLIFESSADSNDFTFSQYEDANGVYTLIGQNIQLSSNGNTNALDSGHRSSGIFFDGRNHGYLTFLTADAGDSPEERMRIDKDGHVLFSGLTSKNDPRNAKGISLKAASGGTGISFETMGSNGSRNWRIRPDDLVDWGTLEFSVSPTSNSSTDWPDATTDIVMTLKPDKNVLVNNGNIEANDNTLSAVSKTASSDTYKDIFVYDTRKDSDGGAWRHRTTNTSWYNETLNTSIRGARREFPQVAIVAVGNAFIHILDADDPDMPMWMKFPAPSGGARNVMYGTGNPRCVYMLNGILCTGSQATNYWSVLIDFIRDDIIGLRNSGGHLHYNGRQGVISLRDSATSDSGKWWPGTPTGGANGGARVTKRWWFDGDIVNNHVTSVVMSVRPEAPIDKTTGMQIPTIYLGTRGGVSVIHSNSGDTGTSYNSGVYDIVSNNGLYSAVGDITITDDGYLWTLHDYYTADSSNYYVYFRDSSAVDLKRLDNQMNDLTTSPSADSYSSLNNQSGGNAQKGREYYWPSTGAEAGTHKIGYSNTWAANIVERDAWGASTGLAFVKRSVYTYDHKESGSFLVRSHQNRGLVAMITKDYNTGWHMTGNVISSCYIAQGLTSSISGSAAMLDFGHHLRNLDVTGTLTRAKCATGSDLSCVSGFSGSNYARITNASLNAGNPIDITMMGWIKLTDIGTYSYLCSIATGSNGMGIAVHATDSSYGGKPYFYDNSHGVQYGDKCINDGEWHHVCGVFSCSSNRKILYVDGQRQSNVTAPSNVNYSDLDTIAVGHWCETSGTGVNYSCTGSLALVKLGLTDLTDQQIKRIYEDEKKLLLPNAKAFLYGSSNAITAIGYDEKKEIYHVGTSSGRSDFSGLSRINNTTTAVTTAISAYDGLIAEQ